MRRGKVLGLKCYSPSGQELNFRRSVGEVKRLFQRRSVPSLAPHIGIIFVEVALTAF